ncbi:MAG: hypothetical protein VW835_11630, partial [Rickettsiales bacterium]
LETLPGRIEELQAKIEKLADALGDPELFAKNPARFEAITVELGQRQSELEDAEEQWLELEVLREQIEG